MAGCIQDTGKPCQGTLPFEGIGYLVIWPTAATAEVIEMASLLRALGEVWHEKGFFSKRH